MCWAKIELFCLNYLQTWDTANETELGKLQFSCPLPLDYVSKMWLWLAIVTCLIFILIVIAILLYTRKVTEEAKQLRLLYYQHTLQWEQTMTKCTKWLNFHVYIADVCLRAGNRHNWLDVHIAVRAGLCVVYFYFLPIIKQSG